MKKYVVRVQTVVGSRFLSGFQWDGDHTVPVLVDKDAAIFMSDQTAAYFVRQLSDAGFSAEVEAL